MARNPLGAIFRETSSKSADHDGRDAIAVAVQPLLDSSTAAQPASPSSLLGSSSLSPISRGFASAATNGPAIAGGTHLPSSLLLADVNAMPATEFSAAAVAAATSIAASAMKTGALTAFDQGLSALYYQYSAGAATAAQMAPFTSNIVHQENALSTAGGHTMVAIDAAAKDGHGATLLAQLKGIGLQGGASFGAMAGGTIDASKLGALLTLSDFGHGSESGHMFNVGSVTTQADAAMLGPAARGDATPSYPGFLDGAGLTIGILSDSFNTSGNADTMTTDINSDDLPGLTSYYGGYPTPTTSVLNDSPGGTDEGRGMAQIVHDIAPGASIIFDTGNSTQATFAQHILDLAAAGAKIIVDDLTYFAEPDYQNGPIAQAIEQVEAQGVTYLSSAGNDASKGLEIQGLTYSGLMNSQAENLNLINLDTGTPYWNVHIPAFTTVRFILEWAQPAFSADGGTTGAHSTSNLDLFLFDSTATTLVASNVEDNATATSDPITIVGVSTGSSAFDGKIAVGNASNPNGTNPAADPSALKIVAFDDGAGTTVSPSALNTDTGTLVGHHGQAGSIAVGAENYAVSPWANGSFPTPEAFSSTGPDRVLFSDTGTLLATPQIARVGFLAAQGGNTTFFGGDDGDADTLPNFYGTSAAAPAAAAIAALMLQENPNLSVTDIADLMRDASWDSNGNGSIPEPAGFDNATGAGLVNALWATQFANGQIVPVTDQTQFLGTHLNDSFVFDNKIYQDGQAPSERFLVKTDIVDGGAGFDSVTLNGDYTGTHALGFSGNNVRNIEQFNLTAGHSYSITTSDSTVAAGATLTIEASNLGAGDVLTFNGYGETNGNFIVRGGSGNDRINLGLGADSVTAGAGNDLVYLKAAALTSADTLNGGAGTNDKLQFGTSGTIAAASLAGVSHFEVFQLGATGTNSLTLTDALVGSSDNNHILTVGGSAGNDTIDASAVTTTANRVYVYAGGGNDTLTGGAGADIFYFATPDLTASDTVNGGTGASIDSLDIATGGTVAAAAWAGVSHIEKILLAPGFSHAIYLSDALVASADDNHVLTVLGGASRDGINAAAVTTATNSVRFEGLGGGDRFVFGAGADTAIYTGVSDSTGDPTGTAFDSFGSFNASVDRIDLPNADKPTSVSAPFTDGTWNNANNFDQNMSAIVGPSLNAHTAVVLHETAGTFAGHDFLVINPTALNGYTSGADYVMDVSHYTGTFATSTFI